MSQLPMLKLVDIGLADDPLADLSPQEFKAVNLYFSGNFRTVSAIAKQVGLHPDTVTKILNKDCVQDMWKRLRGMYYQNMASAAVRGSELVHDILDDSEATYNDKMKAFLMASTASGANVPEAVGESKAGRSASLSEAVAAIIEEAMNVGKKKMLEEKVLNLSPEEDL